MHAVPTIVRAASSSGCIELRLTPLGAHRFLGLPMHELANLTVELEDLAACLYGNRAVPALRGHGGRARLAREGVRLPRTGLGGRVGLGLGAMSRGARDSLLSAETTNRRTERSLPASPTKT
jgi:hypothetical protein